MLTNALLPRGCVASEQNSDGVKLRPRKAADPIVRMVRAGVTDHLPPGRHALSEFLWKCRE
jgi:hypothetical protein